MSLKIIVFEKQKGILNFAVFFLFFVYLLPFHINERPQTTLLAFEQGSIEHILRRKIWL